MTRKAARILLVFAFIAAFFWILPVKRIGGQTNAFPSTRNGEWPMYTADLRGSKYSPLDRINASNFSKLQVAWTFKTDGLSPTPEAKLEGTPIMIKGTLYATGGTRRAVVALALVPETPTLVIAASAPGRQSSSPTLPATSASFSSMQRPTCANRRSPPV